MSTDLVAAPEPSHPLVLPLGRLGLADQALVGHKAAALGHLLQAGLPVPEGFVITAAAFRQYLAAESVPAAATGQPTVEPGTATGAFQAGRSVALAPGQWADAPALQGVARAVLSALGQYPHTTRWAVRSSATSEDRATASAAGQHDTFLQVAPEAVLDRVRGCWSSLVSERALQYRRQHGIPETDAAMAVLLQPMIAADIAGVLFTADPVSGDDRTVVIEAVPGLGDQLVAGRVTPERLMVSKVSGEILSRAHLPGVGPLLQESDVRSLLALSARAMALLPGPLDIEWAKDATGLVVLQARPISQTARPLRGRARTTRPAPGARRSRLRGAPDETWEDRQLWSNVNTGEVLPDVVTPMSWSVLRGALEPVLRAGFQLQGADLDRAPAIGLVAGRVYFNVNTAWAALRPFRFLMRRVNNLVEALGGVRLDQGERGLADLRDEDFPDVGFRWWRFVLSWPRTARVLFRHRPALAEAWLARLKAGRAALPLRQLETASIPELSRMAARLVHQDPESWDLLYLVTQAPALLVFQKACRDWLRDRHLAQGYRLFAAIGGVPQADAGRDLWRLAVVAQADPGTADVLRSGVPWAAARPQLETNRPGREFLATWDAFMIEHGHHCRGELELSNARWSETPDYLLGLVRGYLSGVGQVDPIATQQRLVRERLELTAQCRQRLKHPLKRWIFTNALERAQRLARHRETWKDEAVRRVAALRRVLLELGRRWAGSGILDSPEDVFLLELEELEGVVDSGGSTALKQRLEARRAEQDANRKLNPPPVVLGRFREAASGPAEPTNGATVLRGIPVSPGVAAGPARVILRSADQEYVRPGEILVAPFTDPAWTPYFIPAAGVAVDQGGILSHGSIVAREYGLPAVTSLGSATRRIRTGQWVEVDGTRGEVRIQPEPVEPRD